ncbi:GNAT family N-acetyltransferase [Pseudoalteromonas sp. T1lg75]|uniref:GNAT family N-acetyltransferase n=1 Tax=Pseudoalteromonas sp. T1lg75 TaxID=2077102 RepID=UPI000CF64873|nr:GNAT family N-acetyltransferase [Pseudoalteromonas sp. T1lg75]
MDINQANIANLTSLWERYGAAPLADESTWPFKVNHVWPHRCWHPEPGSLTSMAPLAEARAGVMFPLWPDLHGVSLQFPKERELALKHAGWDCVLVQTAMYLPLSVSDYPPTSDNAVTSAELVVRNITRVEEVSSWIEVVNEAFGYRVDARAIGPLLECEQAQLYVGLWAGEVVASALLYYTGEVVGLHQVALKQTHQGQGLAKSMMQDLLRLAVASGAQYMVLQASAAGRPLYENLGFITQFEIRSYSNRASQLKSVTACH